MVPRHHTTLQHLLVRFDRIHDIVARSRDSGLLVGLVQPLTNRPLVKLRRCRKATRKIPARNPMMLWPVTTTTQATDPNSQNRTWLTHHPWPASHSRVHSLPSRRMKKK